MKNVPLFCKSYTSLLKIKHYFFGSGAFSFLKLFISKTFIMVINESKLKTMIENIIMETLRERKVLKVPHNDNPMPPMQDPNIGVESPMPQDPNMGMNNDPNTMSEDPTMDMGGEMPQDDNGQGVGEIQQMYDGLSDEHQKAVKKYIESMQDQEEENGGENAEEQPQDVEGMEQPMPMQEAYVYTKKQIRHLQESFVTFNNDAEDEKRPKQNKIRKGDNIAKPFKAPKFK